MNSLSNPDVRAAEYANHVAEIASELRDAGERLESKLLGRLATRLEALASKLETLASEVEDLRQERDELRDALDSELEP